MRTSSTIDRLVHAFDQLLAFEPAAPRVRVHDLSLRTGDPMDGHKSHQSGRDVDITYYQHGCGGDCTGYRVAPQTRLRLVDYERGQAERSV